MTPAQIIAFFASNPWRAGCMALALVAASLSAWIFGLPLIGGGLLHQVSECRDGRKADRQSYEAAQVQAQALAEQAKVATERQYQANAERTDHAYQVQLVEARSATADYIATHRVRQQAAGGPSGATPAPAQGSHPAVPAKPAAVSLVAVSEQDIDQCTGAAIYAQAAYQWAQTLNAPAQ